MIRVKALATAVLVGLGASALQTGARADEISQKDIVSVRPEQSIIVKQGIPLFHGISGRTAGAEAISMHKVTIPPGGRAKPHVHKGYETAVYLLKGRVKTLYGEGLKKSVVNEAGDFIYIPADVPHQPINLSDTEAAEAIVARTDPNEQESVHDYPN
jgi:uncharacterized RmlC-like cupin family protein